MQTYLFVDAGFVLRFPNRTTLWVFSSRFRYKQVKNISIIGLFQDKGPLSGAFDTKFTRSKWLT